MGGSLVNLSGILRVVSRISSDLLWLVLLALYPDPTWTSVVANLLFLSPESQQLLASWSSSRSRIQPSKVKTCPPSSLSQWALLGLYFMSSQKGYHSMTILSRTAERTLADTVEPMRSNRFHKQITLKNFASSSSHDRSSIDHIPCSPQTLA
ncbi:hypothetical protein F5880DRAFT_1101192 [Lentinula raphanica]|nr:hypothetical protein F5880DRAFT_1101192 [Lentinula raphanica]